MLCSFKICIFLDIALQFIHLNTTQVYSKEGNHGPSFHEKLLAVGGRYDQLVEQAWDKAYVSCT
jgi:histidyl-tRNA synthetase